MLTRRPLAGAAVVAGGLTALLLLDYFVVRPLQQAGLLDRVATVLNAACTMLALPGLLVARFVRFSAQPLGMEPWVAAALTICLVSGAVYFMLAFLTLRRLGRGGPRFPEFPDERRSRRRFLVRAATGAAVGGAGALAGYGVYVEPIWPRLRRLDLPVRDLPAGLQGARLLHLSDLHLGNFNSHAYIRSVLRQCDGLGADLMLLTGDYVHGSPDFLEPVAKLLAGVEVRHGALAVLGNHDHWEDPARCRAALTAEGIHLVENRRLFLGPRGLSADPPAGGGLCLAGVGDLWEGHKDMQACFGGVDPRTARILLAHNPDFAEHRLARVGNHRVDLMLAGHTHGGQVRLPGTRALVAPSLYGVKYARGFVQGPAFRVFVTTGVGVTILPVRLLVRPEVVLFTLRRA